MKRDVIILAVFLLLFLPFSAAQENASVNIDDTTVVDGKDQAIECLREETQSCSELTFPQLVATTIATGRCATELASRSSPDGTCWPEGSCTVKGTAQALLALDEAGKTGLGDAVDWLMSQNDSPETMEWYVQVESNEETTCDVTYKGSTYSFSLLEDKTLTTAAGSCLTLSADRYWLRVTPSCYGDEFEFSCEEGFQTNLLYKKLGSETIYVSEKTSYADALSATKEKVGARCFANGGACTYEGTLWATLALEVFEKDVSAYLPYLITEAEENERFLPNAFLYHLTSYPDFRSAILQQQKANKYWDESGSKFYDTAIALVPFQYESPSEKTAAEGWLVQDGVQDDNGCWGGSIELTGWLTYALWPQTSFPEGTGGTTDLSCEDDLNGYCSSRSSCGASGGEVLNSDGCATGINVCCSVDPAEQTCADRGGTICNENEVCSLGSTVVTSDTASGQVCCTGGGVCEESTAQEDTCSVQGGDCRGSCLSGEEEDGFYTCPLYGDVCCFEESGFVSGGDDGGSYLWLWIVLGLLIILLIVAIVFRDRLRPHWNTFMQKFKKGGPSDSGPLRGPPGFPRGPPRGLPPRAMPRRPLPGVARPAAPNLSRGPGPMRPTLGPNRAEPNDDVLKKLKEMGKL